MARKSTTSEEEALAAPLAPDASESRRAAEPSTPHISPELAASLPAPLHTLYLACVAFVTAWKSKAAIEVKGSVEEGRRAEAAAAAAAAASTSSAAPSSASAPAAPFEPHPLRLSLNVPKAGKGKGCTLEFLYYPALEMIGVVASPQTAVTALAKLYPDDEVR